VRALTGVLVGDVFGAGRMPITPTIAPPAQLGATRARLRHELGLDACPAEGQRRLRRDPVRLLDKST
jgi:hypothetical protein